MKEYMCACGIGSFSKKQCGHQAKQREANAGKTPTTSSLERYQPTRKHKNALDYDGQSKLEGWVDMKNSRTLTVYKRIVQVRSAEHHCPSSEFAARLSTPEKYVFDVTSVGQRSSPWTCNSVKVEIKFHLECKIHFPSAQIVLRQMYLTNVSESTEAKY